MSANRKSAWMITSPLRFRWQAHGELRIAVLTSGPRHELLLNVELVLRMVLSKAAVADYWAAAAATSPLMEVVLVARSPSSSSTPSSLLRQHGKESVYEPLPRLLSRAAVARAARPQGLRELAALFPAVAGTLPGCEGQEEGVAHTGFHLRPRGSTHLGTRHA